jgi:predicted site-specific integrase-resolvase
MLQSVHLVQTMQNKEEVTPTEAAKIIGYSRVTVYDMLAHGELDYRVCRRRDKERGKTLISRASIEKFLRKQEARKAVAA